ncbi:helix-turn-helix domain-containing protein [Lachnoanaerobaculum sp. Marseille-Q4761]|uniref:helix-turn-helix domain-containing protein n=1 Tax=Lachnoanaerobaculum sp. Marseille-Q4761 TaxID=2819511 RepID=UPI001AA0D1D0|nr:helix-turn-helix domain-containing protein [Lachnoanaerobaculum sp. Marseille-Q4761]MBO1870059.1 helix-turn-helix domain-containing protein [Lachnoanaerobaculum sp. Marseille-Q4761]
MIRYKIDIMKELTSKGYSYTRIKKEKLLSAQTLENIKQGKSITLDTLNKLCLMTKLCVEDIIEVVATDEEKEKYF